MFGMLRGPLICCLVVVALGVSHGLFLALCGGLGVLLGLGVVLGCFVLTGGVFALLPGLLVLQAISCSRCVENSYGI